MITLFFEFIIVLKRRLPMIKKPGKTFCVCVGQNGCLIKEGKCVFSKINFVEKRLQQCVLKRK